MPDRNTCNENGLLTPPPEEMVSAGCSEKQLSEIQDHLAMIDIGDEADDGKEYLKTTPMVSSAVKAQHHSSLVSRYGLLGLRLATYGEKSEENDSVPPEWETTSSLQTPKDNLIYSNISAPWSAFICGSQGSGKSHTLSCLLENYLLSSSASGHSSPLSGLILHYDKFTGLQTGHLCEAAYLCSTNIPVRVLVSPSNFRRMKDLYMNLPGLPKGSPRPEVFPLFFRDEHLTISAMKNLMAIGSDGQTPLYMEVVVKILREMGEASSRFNFREFRRRLDFERFDKGQQGPLNLRLDLLESFLESGGCSKTSRGYSTARSQSVGTDLWEFPKGTLTIIDLSCPFVDEPDACSLFNICVNIFLTQRDQCSRVVALDEAHKYLTTESRESAIFTETLLSVIRLQRHLGTRVIIATQEPTLSPKLLDLCNVTIVHRFSSPAWFKTIEHHLAAAVIDVAESSKSRYAADNLFAKIVGLKTGEALVFAPSALLDCGDPAKNETTNEEDERKPENKALSEIIELGARYVRVKMRKRITADGGRSILAEKDA